MVSEIIKKQYKELLIVDTLRDCFLFFINVKINVVGLINNFCNEIQ